MAPRKGAKRTYDEYMPSGEDERASSSEDDVPIKQTTPARPKKSKQTDTKPKAPHRSKVGPEVANTELVQIGELTAARDHYFEIQAGTCQARRYSNSPKCTACIRRQAGAGCAFRNLRVFEIPVADYAAAALPIKKWFFASNSTPSALPEPPLPFNKPVTPDALANLLKTAGRALLPLLHKELAHAQANNAVRKPQLYLEERSLCDFCGTTLFLGVWVCQECALEYCYDCYDNIVRCTEAHEALHGAKKLTKGFPMNGEPAGLNRREAKVLFGCKLGEVHKAPFMPVFTTSVDYLQHLISQIPADLSSSKPTDKDPLPPQLQTYTLSSPADSLPYVTLPHSVLDETTFSEIWSRGQTVVVDSDPATDYSRWTPESLAEEYGTQKCQVVDCQTAMPAQEMLVKTFFAKFGLSENDRKGILKLKDWPSSSTFKSEFPELENHFNEMVPVPNITRRDGYANISAHFPSNANTADLGPKMYNAFTGRDDKGGKGSTRLHMDVADAVNIMTYASVNPDNGNQGALWFIYPASDTSKIRDYLYRKHAAARKMTPDEIREAEDDPIHSQQDYLDVEMRKELRAEGIIGWKIIQKPGQAVFIPAGSAHQVCNLSDCVKVACDFVSQENVDRCFQLTDEFRKQTKYSLWRSDVLGVKMMIYYCFLSCLNEKKKLESASPKAKPSVKSKSPSRSSFRIEFPSTSVALSRTSSKQSSSKSTSGSFSSKPSPQPTHSERSPPREPTSFPYTVFPSALLRQQQPHLAPAGGFEVVCAGPSPSSLKSAQSQLPAPEPMDVYDAQFIEPDTVLQGPIQLNVPNLRQSRLRSHSPRPLETSPEPRQSQQAQIQGHDPDQEQAKPIYIKRRCISRTIAVQTGDDDVVEDARWNQVKIFLQTTAESHTAEQECQTEMTEARAESTPPADLEVDTSAKSIEEPLASPASQSIITPTISQDEAMVIVEPSSQPGTPLAVATARSDTIKPESLEPDLSPPKRQTRKRKSTRSQSTPTEDSPKSKRRKRNSKPRSELEKLNDSLFNDEAKVVQSSSSGRATRARSLVRQSGGSEIITLDDPDCWNRHSPEELGPTEEVEEQEDQEEEREVVESLTRRTRSGTATL